MRRATCGESAVSPHLGISIHALHEESEADPLLTAMNVGFQSTLSMRRATYPERQERYVSHISIHALHEESDITVPTFEL